MYGQNARSEPRVPMTAPGWLVGARPKFFTCRLVDMSLRGARIRIAADLLLPPHFALCFTSDGQSRRLCRLVWRKGDDAGLRFLPN